MNDSEWKLVVLAAACSTCDCCGEPWCTQCQQHYADCGCPGPHQDDLYEYKEVDGVLYARLREPVLVDQFLDRNPAPP